MSTRATYQFVDADGGDFTVYKHCDGYPSGAAEWISKALKLAWELPRFEASDFAAAFVAANKQNGGGVRLTHGREDHGDLAFHYVITCENGVLMVEIQYPDNGKTTQKKCPLGEFAQCRI